MVDLKHQLELIFLEENLISKEELTSRYRSGEKSLSDIYDGSMYWEFFRNHVENDTLGDIHISLSFCVDGSPLYKSSNTTVWPIVAIVNEIACPKARMKRMLLVGLWYGSKKPKMEVLLEQFSRSSKINETEGLDISFKGRSRKVKIHSLCCCVDSGARGATQGVSQHNGTCACNWCYQNGIEVANATRYPILGSNFVQERSKELHQADCRKLVNALNNGATIDARLVLETRGVRSVTPLMIIPSFDVINGMIVDYMHASTLGLAKAFLTTWLTNADHASYIGTPNSLRLLNAKLNKITRCVEMRKPPRPIDIANWKARELENWILFYSVSVLEGILDDKFYRHWMLFVQLLHTLLQTLISEEDLIVADILIETFIRETEKLYVVEQMSFNVHIHKHIVDNVRRWGPLWAVNAFCFESFLGSLKRKVHANKGIQNQINRSLSHQSAMKIIENSLSLSAKCQKFILTARSYKSRNSQPDVERNGLKLYCRRKENVMFTPEEKWLLSRKEICSDSDRFEDFGKAKLAYPPCVIKIRRPADTSRIRNDTFQLRNGKIVVIGRILDVKNKSLTIAFAKNVHTQPYLPQVYRALARRNSTAVKIATHLEESLVTVSLDEIKTVCYRSVYARIGDVIIPLPNLYNNA